MRYRNLFPLFYKCLCPQSGQFSTHKDVVLYPDDVTSPEIEIGRRQRWDEELLVLPVIGVARADLGPAHAAQLAGLSLDDLVAGHVLDGLE